MTNYGLLILSIIFSSIAVIKSQSCTQPNGRSGVCISIYDCPTVLDRLQSGTLTPDDLRYLQSLQCGDRNGPVFVCCGRGGGGVSGDSGGSGSNSGGGGNTGGGSGSGRVIPKTGDCGLSPGDSKIYGGNATGLGEFPWLALLEYQNPNTGVRQFSCGGSLINKRYLLTAAHCLTGQIIRTVGNLINVRLGEYDINSDRDCVDGDCSDPVLNIGVEKIIPHELYDERSRNKTADIGLIRLASEVSYTSYIQPVCLPSTVNLRKSPPGTNLTSTGWGRTLERKQSDIKLKVKVPVVDQRTCAQQFASIRSYLSDSQLCAGGVWRQDTCDGDSGGPLMKFQSLYWVIEGIVSFGRGCGLENYPAVYTRVSSFENWIMSNLQP